jgi:monoterpene epsilon-lactone hydrolase
MSKDLALESVVAHFKKLTLEALQKPTDVEHRRELLDRYFAVSVEVMESSIIPEQVTVGDRDGYWFLPEGHDGQRRLLYIHGGSWMSGSIKGWAAFVARLADACDCAILFIDYSLMPEAPYPAGLNDCLSAYEWLWDNGPSEISNVKKAKAKKVFIAGDSAGGNLTLACLLAIKESSVSSKPGLIMPDAALAISPCTDFTASGETMRTHQNRDPIINALAIPFLAKAYLKDSIHEVTHPLASPLFGDLEGLPPLMLQSGEAEVLLDDTLRFAEKAKQAGVDVLLDTWPDMPHVFQGFAPFLPQASEAIDRIGEFFKLPRVKSLK